MTQKDFEELEAKYNKMVGLIERQNEVRKLCILIRTRITPSEDPVKEKERIDCIEKLIYQSKDYDINDIEPGLADELLPVIERFYEKLEKEFEEE